MASSLLQPYLSPKTLISSKNQAPALHPSFPSLSLGSVSKFKSFSLFSSSLGKNSSIASSGFARKVAISSEFEQEEDVSNDEREANFSRDLKLFVGNLPFNVDSAELAGLFGRAGNVEMVEVIYDKLTGRSRGFGFVTMSTADEVEAAAQQFNGYELEGRALRVNSGPPPPKDDSRGFRGGGGSNYEDSRGYRGGGGGSKFDDSRGYRGGGGGSNFDDSRGYRGGGGGGGSNFDSANKVYVGNLSWSVDDSALEGLFSEQGKVTEARVVYDRDSGRSRGFGFVTYSSTKEANGAISQLNGVDLDGRSIRVTMAESKPRRQF